MMRELKIIINLLKNYANLLELIYQMKILNKKLK